MLNMNNLWNLNYMNDIKLLQGYIREFDAKSAGINPLAALGVNTPSAPG